MNARKIASVEDVAALYLGPTRPRPTSHWLDGEILSEAPKYIREVIDQINVTYAHSCFDACSVMVRRLVETLLVESFEAQKSLSEITNANGDLVTLKHLIERSQKTNCFTISRQTKNALPRLKDIGDWSAHNRRYLGKQSDLDRIQPALRLALSDLGHIAGMVR
ncbi:MAG: DUF4145 domain-containing protein [Erythrobacter sp.]|uniref:DUF4145 domain-containing protein n=1 Tax=Erythrobacter sp. TaxID=1042 RepID=UPI003298800A